MSIIKDIHCSPFIVLACIFQLSITGVCAQDDPCATYAQLKVDNWIKETTTTNIIPADYWQKTAFGDSVLSDPQLLHFVDGDTVLSIFHYKYLKYYAPSSRRFSVDHYIVTNSKGEVVLKFTPDHFSDFKVGNFKVADLNGDGKHELLVSTFDESDLTDIYSIKNQQFIKSWSSPGYGEMGEMLCSDSDAMNLIQYDDDPELEIWLQAVSLFSGTGDEDDIANWKSYQHAIYDLDEGKYILIVKKK